ncbi:unnamed protein product [Mucor circinelloides]
MASVFFNTYGSTGLHIDDLVYTVKATKKNNIVTTYSQVDMTRFLLTTRPITNIQAPESSSQPPESSSQAPESSSQAPESSSQAPEPCSQVPEPSSQAPEPRSPQPTITTRRKRYAKRKAQCTYFVEFRIHCIYLII